MLTYNLHTHTHNLLTHNLFTHTQLVSSFHVAGVVLAHNLSSHNLLTHNLLTHNLSSHHLLTHNLSSHNLLWRGRCGTYGTGLALVARLVLGVAPGRRGCWRGRRGTWKHPSPFHVAGVVLGDIDFYAGVAGVAFGDIHFRFTWQASSLVTSTCTLAWQARGGSGGALGFRCGAGTPRLLAWQAWHLETSIFVSRGRCGAPAQLVVTQLTHTQLAHTQLVITPRAHIQLVVTQLTLAWQVALMALGWLWWRAWF